MLHSSTDVSCDMLFMQWAVCCLQKAHIHKTIMMILEKDPTESKSAAEKVKREEEERAKQEKAYQVSIWTSFVSLHFFYILEHLYIQRWMRILLE